MVCSQNEICYRCDTITPEGEPCLNCGYDNKISLKYRKIRMLIDWPPQPPVIKQPKKVKKKCLTCSKEFIGDGRYDYCSKSCRSYQHSKKKTWLEEFLEV